MKALRPLLVPPCIMDLCRNQLHLVYNGRSIFRFLKSDYRKAMSDLRGLLKAAMPPKELDERLKWLDDLILAKKHEKALALLVKSFGLTD